MVSNFRSAYARSLKRRQGPLGDTWHLDELFVNIQGRQQYLWRAVDQDGDVIDILVQPRRDRRSADASSRWSPRGDVIMFVRRLEGRFVIFSITPDGKRLKRSTGPDFLLFPWPPGRRYACVAALESNNATMNPSLHLMEDESSASK